MRHLTLHGKILIYGSTSLFLTIILLIGMGLHKAKRKGGADQNSKPVVEELAKQPVAPVASLRSIPSRFPANTHLPPKPEGEVSGSRDPELFSPGRDLVYVDDPRVFWESDSDENDDECDHSMHRAMEGPFRVLVDMVNDEGGTLEVQDAYRASGIHNNRSLHKEGRALDLTCDELGLERLAKLCWAAGFDWVYYEARGRGGAHVHCSVRRDNHLP